MTPTQSNRNKRPTIKDVARICNVSTQTISRVMNNRPDVSAETRKRVLEVIKKLEYQPSALARSLIQKRSYTLGVIIAGLKFVGISQTLNGITEQADKEGYSLLIKELSGFNFTDVQPVILSLMAHQVEAIIYAAPECGDNWKMAQEQCPFPRPPMVFLKGNPYPGFSTISIDNYLGAYLETKHLLNEAGLPPDEKQEISGNWSSFSGVKAMEHLLNVFPEMDGVFAGNDQMALGVLHVAHQKGIRVPEDLALVGFDDLDEAPYFSPSLTTIHHDLHQLGIMAVKKSIELVKNSNREGQEGVDSTIIKPWLIVRESSLFHGSDIKKSTPAVSNLISLP